MRSSVDAAAFYKAMTALMEVPSKSSIEVLREIKAEFTACGIRVCMRTSAIMKRHIQTFHCQDWYSHFVLTQMEKSANAGWGLLRMSG